MRPKPYPRAPPSTSSAPTPPPCHTCACPTCRTTRTLPINSKPVPTTCRQVSHSCNQRVAKSTAAGPWACSITPPIIALVRAKPAITRSRGRVVPKTASKSILLHADHEREGSSACRLTSKYAATSTPPPKSARKLMRNEFKTLVISFASTTPSPNTHAVVPIYNQPRRRNRCPPCLEEFFPCIYPIPYAIVRRKAILCHRSII